MQLISWNFLAVGSPSPIDIPSFERTKEPKTPTSKEACKAELQFKIVVTLPLTFWANFLSIQMEKIKLNHTWHKARTFKVVYIKLMKVNIFWRNIFWNVDSQ